MPIDGVLVNARFYPHSLLGMRIARRHGVRPVVLDHGSAYLSFSNPVLDPAVRLYEHAMTAWGRRYDAAYYGISRKSAEWLGTFGIRAEGVIPNAIDAAGPPPADGTSGESSVWRRLISWSRSWAGSFPRRASLR